ncbi:MAG: hypothetical protein ACRDP6_35910 [Actinoallomurus sp.]
MSRVTDWPMYGNDQYGCCVWSMIGHIIEAVTTYAGTPARPNDVALLEAYTAVTGFNPDDPSTDQGTVIQDALDYWRKTGVEMPDGSRHKILGFAEVNVRDDAEVKAGLWGFCHLGLGINFPDTAMQQFDAGRPWDVVRGARIEGGHAVDLGADGVASPPLEVVTWAQTQGMTAAFWDAYVEEAWIVLLPELVDTDFPEGVDTGKLNALFEALTGEPGPFRPQPQPTPDPPGPPAPPVPVDRTMVLAAKIRDAMDEYLQGT